MIIDMACNQIVFPVLSLDYYHKLQYDTVNLLLVCVSTTTNRSGSNAITLCYIKSSPGENFFPPCHEYSDMSPVTRNNDLA